MAYIDGGGEEEEVAEKGQCKEKKIEGIEDNVISKWLPSQQYQDRVLVQISVWKKIRKNKKIHLKKTKKKTKLTKIKMWQIKKKK